MYSMHIAHMYVNIYSVCVYLSDFDLVSAIDYAFSLLFEMTINWYLVNYCNDTREVTLLDQMYMTLKQIISCWHLPNYKVTERPDQVRLRSPVKYVLNVFQGI